MNKFKKFYFESFDFDKQKLTAIFTYSFDKKEYFQELIEFPNNFKAIDYNIDTLNNLLFSLHIALGVSYYKLYPTKNLIIESGYLSDEQISFWKKFYINGLGEFLIKNNIDPEGLFNFISNSNTNYSSKAVLDKGYNGSFLMWGGGKDSIVSSIILEDDDKDFTPFVFGKIDDIKASTLGVLGNEVFLVKRKLSDNLFKLNEVGYYNGHVPITGIIAFVSVIASYLYNYKEIVLSNEKSASEENTTWKGLKINHQYSKSQEFENDFDNYVKTYLSDEITYYSLLKDKYEYEIASVFGSRASKYFLAFSSCNRNFKINGEKQSVNWCCDCEKCAFVYLILSAFINRSEIVKIFGKDLFENKNLLQTYKGLIGIDGFKPFECVGTYEESLLSFCKNLEKYKSLIITGEITKLPYILEQLEDTILDKIKTVDIAELETKLLSK